MELPQFNSLLVMDDQSLKSLKKSDAIINEDMNRKYLSIEESLKTENSSVNNNVEMWKVELMSKLEREIKLQTTSYIDKFHSVTCKPINSQYCEVNNYVPRYLPINK